MTTFTLRGKVGRVATAVAVVGVAAALLLVRVPAHADPLQVTNSLANVGSDTIQDVDNALAGYTNGAVYSAMHSDEASGHEVLQTWSAFGKDPTGAALGGCITTRAGGASFNRPNGSGAGQKALSRSIDGANWGTNGDACGGPKSIQNDIDFSRSSSAPDPNNPGTALTFVPFGRDAVSYAVYATGTASPVTDLTFQEVRSIYSGSGTGTDITRGGNPVHVVPCGIQSGSGTFKFWLGITNTGSNASTNESTATSGCNGVSSVCPTANCRLEENNGAELKAKGDAIAANPAAAGFASANNVYIIGHSAASFIAQNNGFATNNIGSGVTIGGISDNSPTGGGTNLGLPYTGTGTSLAPNSAFYGDGTFGRYVFHVFKTGTLTGIGNNGLKALFKGSTAIICQTAAQTIVNEFGFLSIPGTGAGTCGDTSQTQALVNGAS